MDNINAEDITRQHDITIEEVKSCSMFAHFTDEQANEVVETVKRLALIILKYAEKSEGIPLKSH